MIDAKEAVIWVNNETEQVMVHPRGCWRRYDPPGPGHWADPIGANYSEWIEGTDDERLHLMLETAIDLAMQGIPLKTVLTAFADIRQFRALGGKSYPMCRALTSALIGRCLEHPMGFEELLVNYAEER